MKRFRQRHSVSAAVVVLCACLAGTTAALATTVVAIWRPDRVILAADSEFVATRQGTDRRFLGCKIFREGNVFLAAAGMLGHGPPASFNVYTAVFKASLGGGNVRAIANRFERTAETPFLRAVRAMQKKQPTELAETCPHRNCLDVAIGGIDRGKPALSVRGFTVFLRGGVVHVAPSKRYDMDCPEDCGDRQRTIVLGANHLANQLLTGKVSLADLGPVAEASNLIVLESLSQPRYVRLPMSILELDKNGARWATGQQGKCR